MSIHYNSGTSVGNNKAAISMAAGTSSRSDVHEVAQINPEKTDNNALASKDFGTIKRSGSGTVTDLTTATGNVALELCTLPAEGTSVHVRGASYPHNGTYGVIGISGTYALTDVPYLSCTGINVTNATYTRDSGTLSPISQRDYLIRGVTTSLGGFANTALQTGIVSPSGHTGMHQFRSYRSRVYATGWQSFTGSVSPCDITNTTVSLSTDDAVSEHTVVLSVGGNPKAADITNPDTTGLRAPSP